MSSHDKILEAIEKHSITDVELRAALRREGSKDPDHHIRQMRDGGAVTIILALAVFRIIGKREAA